jgi:arylsulfatase A-like enzyme
LGDHGGFAYDDINVMLMVAHHGFTTQTVSSATATTHVAPTILKALGLEPGKLDVVRLEGKSVLPEVEAQLAN